MLDPTAKFISVNSLISGNNIMDIAAALQIVTDLAKQNVLDHKDVFEDDLTQQMLDQEEAINMVEDMAVNQFGDDNIDVQIEPDPIKAFDRLHEDDDEKSDGFDDGGPNAWFQRGYHTLVAELQLSGSHWIVGYVNDKNPLNGSLFIKHEDSSEATFFSALEGNLLMSAIVCAQNEVSSLMR